MKKEEKSVTSPKKDTYQRNRYGFAYYHIKQRMREELSVSDYLLYDALLDDWQYRANCTGAPYYAPNGLLLQPYEVVINASEYFEEDYWHELFRTTSRRTVYDKLSSAISYFTRIGVLEEETRTDIVARKRSYAKVRIAKIRAPTRKGDERDGIESGFGLLKEKNMKKSELATQRAIASAASYKQLSDMFGFTSDKMDWEGLVGTIISTFNINNINEYLQ